MAIRTLGIGVLVLAVAGWAACDSTEAGPQQVTGAKKVPINLEAPLATGAAHYAWSVVSAPAGMDVRLLSQGRYATVEASRSGVVEVRERTMVDGTLVRESRFEVTVINQPPTATFTATLGGGARFSGRLDASRSGDPDLEEITYTWLVEGPGEATAEPNANTTLLASAAGTYSIRLIVTDEEGATAEADGSLRVYDSVFDTILDTPSFGNPVHAWAAGALLFPGGTIGIVDVATGTLDTDAVVGSATRFDVTPDGRAVMIGHHNGPLEYYDAVAKASLGTVEVGGRNWTPVDGAIYWIAEDATGARLQRYDLDQQQAFDTAPTGDHVHAPIVSTALGGVVVPVGTETTVERFEIYDFGAPPALTATVAASLPWGTVDVFTGGDRVSVRGGPIYRITHEAVETLDPFGHEYRAFAHNPEAGVFAVLHSLRLRIYSDQTYALLEDLDLTGWIGRIGWQRVFRHAGGFMVVSTAWNAIANLYIEPDPG